VFSGSAWRIYKDELLHFVARLIREYLGGEVEVYPCLRSRLSYAGQPEPGIRTDLCYVIYHLWYSWAVSDGNVRFHVFLFM
jgi:hypothetical protein